MKSKKFHIISYQLYPFDVLLTVGTTRDEIVKYLNKVYSKKLTEKEIEALDNDGKYGKCTMLLGGQTVIWLKKWDKTMYGSLLHECIHAVYFLFDRIGLEVDVDNHEALTYTVQYIFEESTRYLSKK